MPLLRASIPDSDSHRFFFFWHRCWCASPELISLVSNFRNSIIHLFTSFIRVASKCRADSTLWPMAWLPSLNRIYLNIMAAFLVCLFIRYENICQFTADRLHVASRMWLPTIRAPQKPQIFAVFIYKYRGSRIPGELPLFFLVATCPSFVTAENEWWLSNSDNNFPSNHANWRSLHSKQISSQIESQLACSQLI